MSEGRRSTRRRAASVQQFVSIEIAASSAGLSPARVRHLVRVGLVQPAAVELGQPLFGDIEVARLRKVRRLTTDLGVNLAGVEIILRLTEELAAARGTTSQ
ncbi:MAG: MerR family transcriptional regulator [Chloroflexi bacterium]|nr:MerR family transcriptional regulator [Chloroflexota bacterium]MBV9601122.1 MerR family transcriptional regulator [Chloroflexota bacterium]